MRGEFQPQFLHGLEFHISDHHDPASVLKAPDKYRRC